MNASNSPRTPEGRVGTRGAPPLTLELPATIRPGGRRRHRLEPAAPLVPVQGPQALARLGLLGLARHGVGCLVLPARPVRPAPDVPLRAVGRAGLPVGQGHRVRGDVRLVASRGAPHRRAPDGRRRRPAPGKGVSDRRLQERRRPGSAAGMELGDRRRDALADPLPLLHRLPASVGSAGLLGGDRRHQHRVGGAGRRSGHPGTADWRARHRTGDADSLLRAAYHRPPGRAGRVGRLPHVAHPQRRRPGEGRRRSSREQSCARPARCRPRPTPCWASRGAPRRR